MHGHRLAHLVHVRLENVEEYEWLDDLPQITGAHQPHDGTVTAAECAVSDPSCRHDGVVSCGRGYCERVHVGLLDM